MIKMSKILSRGLLAVLLTAALQAQAAVYYVATDGSDSADGSQASPFATIGQGISALASGDTLIVRDGIYEGKANFIRNLPSGSPGNYTTVKAENPLEVRIRETGELNYVEEMIELEGSYMRADGFIIDLKNSATPPFIVKLGGDHLKLTRSIIKRGGELDPYGGLVNVDGSYNLVEDVAGVGVCRYCFFTGGPSDDDQYNIFRRVVGRFDYANSDQPKATFATYGNNSGHNVHSSLYQNVIALDGNAVPIGNEKKYGGFYNPKNAKDVHYYGSMVLNEGTHHAGMFVQEQQGEGTIVEHTVVWDLHGNNGADGIRENGGGGQAFRNLTIGGDIPDDFVSQIDGSSPSNSIIGGNPASLVDGGGQGATILYRYGKSGTLWGEAGYDQLTDEPLWPWPYEDKIKEVFAEPHQPPSGYAPSSNETVRGFTVAKDRFDQPMTLTRYIWQYLGEPVPADMYTAPAAPTGLTATLN